MLGVVYGLVQQAGDVMVIKRVHRASTRTMPGHKVELARETKLIDTADFFISTDKVSSFTLAGLSQS
jgi:hypothetical protein